MLIKIVHLKRSGLVVDNLIALDRSTIYGNDFSHLPNSKAKVITKTVAEAIACFNTDLRKRLKTDTELKAAYETLYRHCCNVDGVIHFGCWCMDEYKPSPKDHGCHTETIRKIFINRFKRETS